MRHVTAATLALLPTLAGATTVDFADGWREQRLKLLSSNEFTFDERLGVVSDKTVSLVWTQLDTADWGATQASWDWSVESSVDRTDLSVKGGDDRNLSIFFVFLPEDQAAELEGTDIRRLMRYDDVRILQYVWGGDVDEAGALIPSPHLAERGAIVSLHPAETGTYDERLDLAADYERAFGAGQTALVGLAVSADSDDTEGMIAGEVGPITLE